MAALVVGITFKLRHDKASERRSSIKHFDLIAAIPAVVAYKYSICMKGRTAMQLL
jgi:hypothetical protein